MLTNSSTNSAGCYTLEDKKKRGFGRAFMLQEVSLLCLLLLIGCFQLLT